MTTLTLTVQERTLTGNQARKIRRAGNIPGVIYGNNVKDLVFEVDYNTFVRLYKAAGNTHVVDVTLGKDTYHCLVQDIDVDPVSDRARHIDFLAVDLKKKVVVEVPLEFVGESEAVVQGAILVESMHEVEVEALPNEVPEMIEVDIAKLVSLHDNIHVSDLPVTSKFVILTDPNLVVASVVEPEKEEAPAPVATEGVAEAAPTAEKPEEKKE